jgi:hypothetical protein
VSTAAGIFRNEADTYDRSTPPTIAHYLVQTLGDRARNEVLVHEDDDGDNDPTDIADDDGVAGTDTPVLKPIGFQRQWVINAWTARANWGYDTRNDYVMPSRGILHHVQGEIALPGSDLEYYRLSYDFEHYWQPRFAPWVILKSAVSLGYGDSYGDTHKAQCLSFKPNGFTPIPDSLSSCPLPFFKNFYAGGPARCAASPPTPWARPPASAASRSRSRSVARSRRPAPSSSTSRASSAASRARASRPSWTTATCMRGRAISPSTSSAFPPASRCSGSRRSGRS